MEEKQADQTLNLTVEEVRDFLEDGNEIESLTTALDEAQGAVFSGGKESTTLLIVIKKES